ncbi:MAG: DUF1080 domain-containing protein [Bryobacterales bacterium]|nr:DUF1080 domain-containing protein [Bryobacterales bacterium]
MALSRRALFATAAAVPALLRASTRELFNNRDFTGWKQYGSGNWTVEEGAFVCRSHPTEGGPGYLFTTEEFTDFTFDLEFWVSRGGNSGIFIRQPLREFGRRGDARPAHSKGDGVEIQMDYNDPKNLTGSVYNRKQSTKLVGGEDRWNRYRIACTGPRVQVFVDGEQVNDYGELPSPKGAIGLQMHGAKPHGHVVRFRNIRITTA